MERENQLKSCLTSPLAGGPRRTGKRAGEGERGNTLLSPLIGFECLRTQNHFPRGAARRVGSQTTSGFTLIELLVVVLIIGILSAVALPQYQKAVEKSRATQAITMLKSLYQAADAYYLANGEWPKRFDELGIDFQLTTSTVGSREEYRSNTDWTIGVFNNGLDHGGAGVWATRRTGKYPGATFYIWKEGFSPSQVLLCGEKYGTAQMSTQDKGAYCVKLFKGTRVGNDSNSLNVYTLP